MGKLNEIFSGTFMVLLIIAYFGSLPLAIIFGDKWDVVISLFIPNIWVLGNAWCSSITHA
jgi:hypothetical protein